MRPRQKLSCGHVFEFLSQSLIREPLCDEGIGHVAIAFLTIWRAADRPEGSGYDDAKTRNPFGDGGAVLRACHVDGATGAGSRNRV